MDNINWNLGEIGRGRPFIVGLLYPFSSEFGHYRNFFGRSFFFFLKPGLFRPAYLDSGLFHRYPKSFLFPSESKTYF